MGRGDGSRGGRRGEGSHDIGAGNIDIVDNYLVEDGVIIGVLVANDYGRGGIGRGDEGSGERGVESVGGGVQRATGRGVVNGIIAREFARIRNFFQLIWIFLGVCFILASLVNHLMNL